MKRALAVLPMLAVPAVAQACAACGAIDRNRAIFLFTTIMLSLLPLVLVGLGLLWIARRSKERLKAEFAEREAPFVGAGAAPGAPGGRKA